MEIQVDPVGKGMKPETDYSQFPKADIILVTHEHHDHFDSDAIAQLTKASTKIYLNPAVHKMLGSGKALKNGDKVKIANDITIEAVPAYNTTPGLDGMRIYIAGDTEDIPEMANIKDISIAFLPCNQPYTMTIEQAANAAKIIKPKVLFPYHYNDTPVNKLTPQLSKEGIRVLVRNYQ